MLKAQWYQPIILFPISTCAVQLNPSFLEQAWFLIRIMKWLITFQLKASHHGSNEMICPIILSK